MPLAIDPVCGDAVEQDEAAAEGRISEAHGQTYYFCSEGCLHDFEAAPLYYAGKVAEQRAGEAPYDYPCQDWE